MADEVTLSEQQRAALRTRLVEGANLSDVRALCHDLTIDYEDIAGETKTAKIAALLTRLQQLGQTAKLLAWLRANRPDLLQPPATQTSTPRIWNITHQRNPNFTGREQLLAELRHEFMTGGTTMLPQVITGLGGIGKTQTAVEYAYRHQDNYAVVWWVNAEERATLLVQFAALAAALGLPEAGIAEQRVTADAVRRWLAENGRWLLVLDNVERPDDVKPYLPRPMRGHVLVTSRYRAWGGLARAVEMPSLSPDEAAAFLLQRTGQTDQVAAQALAHELGGLPLALEQAGAYIDRRTLALTHYLTLYHKHHLTLLEKEKPSQDYPATVATTWALAFEQVETAMPEAADLLRLCAFLAPDLIPLDILVAGAEQLPDRLAACVTDELALPDALGILRDYSLVEVSSPQPSALSTLSVHRLVQAVTRARLDSAATRTWAEAAVRVVNAAVPEDSDDYRNWPTCERLLAHGLQATETAEALGVAWAATAELLNQGGLYLWSRAQYRAARVAMERALRIREAALGPDHPDVAECHNNLALILEEMGDTPAARTHYERALRIEEGFRGPVHPVVAIILSNLGNVLRALGDLPTARAYLERALQISEATLGADDPAVATRLNNLGNVLRALGDLPAARAHHERALRIRLARFGPDHPLVANSFSNLGNVLRALGDLPAARDHYTRALRIREDKLGPDHPDVATSLHALGVLHDDLGDRVTARGYLERAVRIYEATLGPEHPSTVTSSEWLALVLRRESTD